MAANPGNAGPWQRPPCRAGSRSSTRTSNHCGGGVRTRNLCMSCRSRSGGVPSALKPETLASPMSATRGGCTGMTPAGIIGGEARMMKWRGCSGGVASSMSATRMGCAGLGISAIAGSQARARLPRRTRHPGNVHAEKATELLRTALAALANTKLIASASPAQQEGAPAGLENEPSDALRYLESRGVDLDLIEDVAIPHSLSVLEERLDFLDALGVDGAELVNAFPPLIGCSVARNFVPVLTFLETIPIAGADLPGVLLAYPEVLYSSVVIDLVPQIDFLKGIGIAEGDLGKVIVGYPAVLGLRIEGTMSTSVAYLVGIGVSMRAIGPMLTQQPRILGMRVATNLMPKVRGLSELGIRQSQVAKLLEKHPWVLALNMEREILVAVDALKDLGLDALAIGQVVLLYPHVLKLNVKLQEALEELQVGFRDVFGLERTQVAAVVQRMPQLVVLEFGKLQEKLDFFRKWGFSTEDVAAMVVRCPQVLSLSIGASIGPKLSFLLDDRGRTVADVAAYPECLLRPLEVLQEREATLEKAGLQRSLPWMLDCSDDDFDLRVDAERRT